MPVILLVILIGFPLFLWACMIVPCTAEGGIWGFLGATAVILLLEAPLIIWLTIACQSDWEISKETVVDIQTVEAGSGQKYQVVTYLNTKYPQVINLTKSLKTFTDHKHAKVIEYNHNYAGLYFPAELEVKILED